MCNLAVMVIDIVQSEEDKMFMMGINHVVTCCLFCRTFCPSQLRFFFEFCCELIFCEDVNLWFVSNFREDLAVLNIYYQAMSYDLIEMVPAYSIVALLCKCVRMFAV